MTDTQQASEVEAHSRVARGVLYLLVAFFAFALVSMLQSGRASADPLLPLPTPVDDLLEPVTAPVEEIVEPVTAPVEEVVAPVTAPVEEAVAPVAEAVAPVTAPVKEVVEPVAEVVKPVVAPVAEPVKPVVTGVVAPVTEVVKPVVTGVVAPVTEVVKPVVTGVVAPATEIIDPVVDGVVAPVTEIIEPVVNPASPSGQSPDPAGPVGTPPVDDATVAPAAPSPVHTPIASPVVPPAAAASAVTDDLGLSVPQAGPSFSDLSPSSRPAVSTPTAVSTSAADVRDALLDRSIAATTTAMSAPHHWPAPIPNSPLAPEAPASSAPASGALFGERAASNFFHAALPSLLAIGGIAWWLVATRAFGWRSALVLSRLERPG